MNSDHKPCPKTNDAAWIERSFSFRRWMHARQAILDHKWYESERAGHDIGWDRAAVDYMLRFRTRVPPTQCKNGDRKPS